MTTWASNAARHPWFSPPSMKRKSYANDDSDNGSSFSEASPSTCSTSRRKRVRHDSLERTLAHMTIGSAHVRTPEDVDMCPRTSPPCPPHVQETLNVVLPSSIEEPDTPPSLEPDDMEVEPTLDITNMPSTSVSDGWDNIKLVEVQISSAVLECLKRPPPIVPLSPPTSQALVLYRTLRPPSPTATGSPPMVRGDDVMEVEY